MACDSKLSNYQKNETKNYLQNYTQDDIQIFMNTQNTFSANYAEGNNINNTVNDSEMSDDFDGGGIGGGLTPFDEIDPADAFDFEEMSIDPALSNDINLVDDIDGGALGNDLVPFEDEAMAGGSEDPPATGNKEHHYSEVDNDG